MEKALPSIRCTRVHLRIMVVFAGVLLAALFLTESGFAAPPSSDAAHGEGGGSLPQMDPKWFASQIFWMSLIFISLYVIFAKRVLPEFSSIIEQRRERIQGDLNKADSLKKEAEEVYAAYEEMMEEARDKSSRIFAQADHNLKEKLNKEQIAFQGRAQKETESTEKQLAETKLQVMDQMNAVAAEVASLAAEKIIGIQADINHAKAVVKNLNKKAA